MRGINKVTLVGNAGKDPEYRVLSDGTPVAKVNLATTETYRLGNGRSGSHTEWHSVILWRGLAMLAKEYIRKGSLIYLEGRIRSRVYTDKEENRKQVTEIVADQLLLLGKNSKVSAEAEENNPIDEVPF